MPIYILGKNSYAMIWPRTRTGNPLVKEWEWFVFNV
jgi:hypothetical protein